MEYGVTRESIRRTRPFRNGEEGRKEAAWAIINGVHVQVEAKNQSDRIELAPISWFERLDGAFSSRSPQTVFLVRESEEGDGGQGARGVQDLIASST